MFESALLTRAEEISVLHEPMGEAWYFSKEKQSDRYSDEMCAQSYAVHKEATFAKVSPVTELARWPMLTSSLLHSLNR